MNSCYIERIQKKLIENVVSRLPSHGPVSIYRAGTIRDKQMKGKIQYIIVKIIIHNLKCVDSGDQ